LRGALGESIYAVGCRLRVSVWRGGMVDRATHGYARHLLGVTGTLKTFLLLLAVAGLTSAHNGPPFPMISSYRMGPCVVSLWTHPDVGVGTFFVIVSPAPGKSIPKDLKFEIGVLPATKRLKEKFYWTTPQEVNGQIHYNAWVPFDRQELWRVNLYMRSSVWNGETAANVEVTPTGLGQWDLLLFSTPFLGVGFLWFMGMKRKRLRRSRRPVACG
jgi:hypothetical protein